MCLIANLTEGNSKIILAADANEHAENGKLAKELKRIGLITLCAKKFNQSELALHASRSNPIDRIWTSSNISDLAVSTLPHKFGAGDHRIILANFDLVQIVEQKVRTGRPQMRRLTCGNKRSVLNYNATA